MITRDAVGTALRSIRVEKGLRLEDVAIPAGTDAGNLSRIERGQQGYTDETLARLADALGTRPSQIYARAERDAPAADGAIAADTLRLAKAIQSLSRRDRGHLQAVVDSFVKSTPWDGEVERRRGQKL